MKPLKCKGCHNKKHGICYEETDEQIENCHSYWKGQKLLIGCKKEVDGRNYHCVFDASPEKCQPGYCTKMKRDFRQNQCLAVVYHQEVGLTPPKT